MWRWLLGAKIKILEVLFLFLAFIITQKYHRFTIKKKKKKKNTTVLLLLLIELTPLIKTRMTWIKSTRRESLSFSVRLAFYI